MIGRRFSAAVLTLWIVSAMCPGAGAQDHTIVDGTTGVPLGGVGAGAVKFDAYRGNFTFTDMTPARNLDYQNLGGAAFQYLNAASR